MKESPRSANRASKTRILGQKAVARMHGIAAVLGGDLQNAFDIEIRL